MWQTFSTIINIILAVITAYFYFALKGLKVERSLAMKKAELKNLKDNYSLNMVGTAGYYRRDYENIGKEENEYIYKVSCVEAEIKELEKILKRFYFKWFIQ